MTGQTASNVRLLSWQVACLAILLLFAERPARAASPFNRLVPLKRVAANKDDLYPLSEENGPWMIMATTFSGDGAEEQARELVHELRSTYKLPAYSYRKRFDYSKKVEGRGIDKYGTPLQMRYQRGEAIDEIAVLVGDYPAVDDPAAQKVLKKLKYVQPVSLKLENGKSTSQSLAALRLIQQKLLPDGNDRKKKGPMGHAFVTANPLLPHEYYVPKGIDKLVLNMNKGVKYSLLDCPDRYSLKVATFNGNVVIDQKIIKQVEEGASIGSRLAEAADKAHKVTMALREKGYEAYEFHDRYMSMVCVGSFKTVGSPRADGKTEINPIIHRYMTTFGADRKMAPGQAAPQVGPPKKVAGIPLDLQPIPVEIPRRSVSSDYAR